MSTALNLHDILNQVQKLNKEEQLTLLERIITIIRKSEKQARSSKLSSISGVGSKVWENVNIGEYIDQERQW